MAMAELERALARARPERVWRAVAAALLVLRGLAAAAHFFGACLLEPVLPANHIMTMPVFMLSSGLTAIALAALLAFPLQFYIYAGICAFWGLLLVADGGGVTGCVIYCIGAVFARRQGFYRTRRIAKAAGTFLLLAGAIVSQCRYGAAVMAHTLLESIGILFLFMLCRFGLPLLFQAGSLYGQGGAAGPVRKAAAAPPPDSGGADKDLFERIRAGEKYEAIAKAYGVSLRTVSRLAKDMYAGLGAANRADFLRRYGRAARRAEAARLPAPEPAGAGSRP